MADLKSFQVYDLITGLPKPTAAPVFLDYRDRDGNALTEPDIVHVANGVFAFSPSPADVALGVAWVVSTGEFPARYFGEVSDPEFPFWVGVFEDGAGALADISATPPTLDFFKTRAGVDLFPVPSPVNVSGGYLWSVTPADASNGCVFDVVAPTGAYPAHYAGDLLSIVGGGNTTTTVVLSGSVPATTTTVALPFVPSGITSSATGIFQSDLCLRHALIEGMRQIRNTPWLLDSITRGITFDTLTNTRYGQKELDQLKKWFQNTDIPVIMYRLGDSKVPSISLALVSSNLDAATLGDIHYDPFEEVGDAGAYVIAGPFDGAYDGSTGIMTLPPSLTPDVFKGMVVMDSKGQEWEIEEVLNNLTPVSLKLATGILTTFTGASIRAPAPNVVEFQESIKMKESWSIGIHVNTTPGHLLFLHAVVSFILLWGRQSLFEARGFELSDFSSTDFSKNQAFDEENVWSRFISLTGMTQSVWPKRRVSKIAGLRIGVKIIDGENVPNEFGNVNDLSWVGEDDSLG